MTLPRLEFGLLSHCISAEATRYCARDPSIEGRRPTRALPAFPANTQGGRSMSMRLWHAALLAPLLLVVAPPSEAQNLEIHYINVGWGSSVLLRGPDGTTVLLEAGNTGMGTARVVPYLTSIGIPPSAGLDY